MSLDDLTPQQLNRTYTVELRVASSLKTAVGVAAFIAVSPITIAIDGVILIAAIL